MRFTERLHKKVMPIWKKSHDHPFVQGIGHGTLDQDKFRFYMIQDYLFLIDYAKLFGIGAIKANDLKTMGQFAKLLDATLNEEMALHREYAKKFGILEAELENAQASPITLAYSHYMLHVGQNGSLAELVASLLPCMWSYSEIGKELSKLNGALSHEFYGEWVQMYSSEEFGELAAWLIGLLDELAEGKLEAELSRLEEIFVNTSRYEYMFWDMSYHQSMWPTE
ncbi:thiaminase II [Bacillus taeanensis]|uniref:Aminopyrimidine aminohydrolase n=1 Tax=Bacillus taeanensis TaxID=273032 RepID=A0A366Y070_9BACI|nr:thiaminase II [Bacillus taeanensis]RBW71246.1 thiaminase II [Bacillus taeanensis]